MRAALAKMPRSRKSSPDFELNAMTPRQPSSSPTFLPLLVTGIAGVAGYNAFLYLRSKFPGRVFGVRRPDNWPLSGEGILACDLGNRDRVQRLFDRYQFAAVLNGEGSCKLKSCELDPDRARRINVHRANVMLDVLEGTATRMVHMSVDLVFSGTGAGSHREDDPTDPVTVYGRTMAEAERIILDRRPAACILRISLPMGISFNGHAGAIDWIQSRFKKSKPATLFFDEIRTPTYTDCLNRLWENVLRRELSGLFHAGGPRRLSLFQIAQVVNRVGGYDPRHLHGCMRLDVPQVPPRAGNVTLDSSRLVSTLGYDPFDPWPLEDRWVPSHAMWHYERPASDEGSPRLLEEILYRNTRRCHEAAG